MSDLFYVFGLGLVVLAVVVAFAGMKSEKFPSTRGAYLGGLTVMTFFVVGSCAFAIVLAREEKEHRSEEIAEFRAEEAEEEAEAAEAEDAGAEPGEDDPTEQPGEDDPEEPETEPGEPLMVTSPEAGDLLFETTELVAPAGEVVIDYTNPSQVPHNLAIEIEGEDPAQGETVTGGSTAETSADLEPGEYAFYCSIPGHRESGMEGLLIVE